MAKMGFRKLNDMIGRCDLLEPAEPLNAKVKVSLICRSGGFEGVNPQTFLSLFLHFFLFTFIFFLTNLLSENMQKRET